MRRYTLPILSGFLLALVFYPFYFWPLVLVALTPLFYFLTQERSSREVFVGGAITGLIVAIPLVYFSLALIRVLPEAVAFSYAMRASSVVAVALIGLSFGAMAIVYKLLRTRSLLLNTLIAASLFSIFELIQFFIYSGYYLGSLAHAAVPLPAALTLASLGGAPLLSFFIVWINGLIAEVAARKFSYSLFLLVLPIAILSVAPVYKYPISPGGGLSVAIIQLGFEGPSYGKEDGGKFSNPTLEPLITEAAQGSDLVVYPFSIVSGALYRGEPAPIPGLSLKSSDRVVGEWLTGIAPTSATVLFWNTLVEDKKIFDEYMLWRDGESSEYRKRVLHPLSDYAPAWTRPFGLHAFSYTTSAGEWSMRPKVGEIEVGGLLCSELHQEGLVREEAKRSPLLIAVGSDTMFPGDLAGNFSLAAARLRAAENGTPVIRGNLHGPSAIVDFDGSVLATLPYGESGILRAVAPLSKVSTPYSRFGSTPLYVFIALVFALASLKRNQISS